MKENIELTGQVIYKNMLYDNEQLKRSVNHLVNMIAQNTTVNEKHTVAVFLDRSIELIQCICALFEMKIPFLLLNDELPEKRIEYMLNKAEIDTVLTIKKYENLCRGKKVILIENLYDSNDYYESKSIIANKIESDIAYVLFTSGSTGEPKAVQVMRKGLINFINSVPQKVNINKETIIGCFTNCTFDIFFLESLVALYSGATVVVAEDEIVNNTKKLIKLISESSINTLQFTPSRLKMIQMVDKEFSCFQKIKTLMVGGETFTEELLQTIQKNTSIKIYNMYGPTETTIWSTISDLTNAHSVDIGAPIDNTEIFILDTDRVIETGTRIEQKNVGEVGEICIGGYGLAKGYLNNNEQTRKSFLDVVINNKQLRIYKTGDLGYYRNDGKLICLGRMDNQIKYDGHRIEIEEIEKSLLNIEGIINVAVCFDKKYNQLIAFVIKDNAIDLTKDRIDNQLKKTLPNYMCPCEYMFIDQLLYTTSGKLDRNALIDKYIGEFASTNVRDNEDIMSKMVQVISKILNKQASDINMDMSIAAMGISSIKFVQIIVELEDQFDIEFDDEKIISTEFEKVKDLYEYLNTLVNG